MITEPLADLLKELGGNCFKKKLRNRKEVWG